MDGSGWIGNNHHQPRNSSACPGDMKLRVKMKSEGEDVTGCSKWGRGAVKTEWVATVWSVMFLQDD